MARRKIQSKQVGKEEQSSVYFLLKNVQVIPSPMPSEIQRYERYERYERYLLQGDILGYIKRDILNLLIGYPKYLKRSSADYKEKIDNYTKYLKVKI